VYVTDSHGEGVRRPPSYLLFQCELGFEVVFFIPPLFIDTYLFSLLELDKCLRHWIQSFLPPSSPLLSLPFIFPSESDDSPLNPLPFSTFFLLFPDDHTFLPVLSLSSLPISMFTLLIALVVDVSLPTPPSAQVSSISPSNLWIFSFC